jgi:hypothetical protein
MRKAFGAIPTALCIWDIGAFPSSTSAGGAQPMWTADEAIGIVFNGEIYNHAELREELKKLGALFMTDHSGYRGPAARLPHLGR